MIQESIQSGLESKLALSMALGGNHNKDLTEQESESNIADNLVTIAAFDGINKRYTDGSLDMKTRGNGTGLLITTDGFIITAYHNIAPYESDWKRIYLEEPPTEANIYSWMEKMKMKYAVIDKNRTAYPIDITLFASVPSLDIALIKAVILRKPQAIDFSVVTRDLDEGDEIKLFGLSNQRPYNQLGKVISATRDAAINNSKTGNVVSTTYDTFLTDAYSIPGFSGGIFTNLRGEFAGMSLYGQKIGKGNGIIGHCGGAKAKHIVYFLRECTDKLDNNIKGNPDFLEYLTEA